MKRLKQGLKDVCSIQYGYAFDSTKFSDDNNNIAIIRIRDVKNGYSNTFYSGEYDKTYLVNPGEILVGMDGEFNISKWKSNPALLNQRVCKISAKENVVEDYLQYYLSKELKKIERRTSFVTVKHLSAKELNALYLDMHSYGDQKTIANLLRISESIIAYRKLQIEKLNQLIKSRFVEMYSSCTDELEIGNFFSEITKGPFGSDMKKSLFVPKGVDTYKVYIQLNVIEDNPILGNYYISNDYYLKKCIRYEVKSNDILITCDGTMGKITILPNLIEKGVISSSLLKIRLNENIIPVFFRELWTSVILEIALKSVNNSALKHLPSAKVISKIKTKLPSLQQQNQFAKFVNHVDKLKFEVQKSLDETQTLFNSLMQKYFG